MDVNQEYERIKELFNGADENMLKLIDGAIWEAAKIRIDLYNLNEIKKKSGLIKVHPTKPEMQKVLPVAKEIIKVRANYLNYIYKLANILNTTISEDEEEELNDYE